MMLGMMLARMLGKMLGTQGVWSIVSQTVQIASETKIPFMSHKMETLALLLFGTLN